MPLVLPTSADIREVGLRDGLQLEAPIPLSAKLDILDAVVAAGLRRVEATSFVSPKAVPALADAAELATHLHRWPEVFFSALVAGVGGARRLIEAGMANIEYVVSATDGHSNANARRDTAQALAATEEIARLAHGAGGQLEVIIAVAWDCPFEGRTPVQRTVEIARKAVELGADELCLGDTIGTTVPGRVIELLDAVSAACPGTPLGVHFHNTRGAGIASVLTALDYGITKIDAATGGLGGCPFAPGASGHLATEEVVYLLEGSGVRTGVELDALLAAAAVIERAVGHDLASNLYRAGGVNVARGR